MTALGIELCDGGLFAAVANGNEIQPLPADALPGAAWPGFAWHDGRGLRFGREAEDAFFVHPRQVANSFLAKLNHEASSLSHAGRAPSQSELAYHFIREYTQTLERRGVRWDKVVLAVPGSYLKDPATEEEKVGLLLGIAGELKLPLAGIVDLSCASLCDTRGPGFNPALPVLVVDVHLHSAEFSLLAVDEQMTRRNFLGVPLAGSLALLKALTGTMGNRFLRHTAFDILADGRIEQQFFRQTEEFVLTGVGEYRYQINTATRAYDLVVKQDQLISDAQPFVSSLARSLRSFMLGTGLAPEVLTAALTHRAAVVPGLEARLRSEGFRRILRLPTGAAACGAARIGQTRLERPADLADVAVETSVPVGDTHRASLAPWQAHLLKAAASGAGTRPLPTHAIIDGVGHVLGGNGRLTIGSPLAGATLPLPDSFSVSETCLVPLVREQGRLWYVDPVVAEGLTNPAMEPRRASVEAGDRLTIRSGGSSVEVLFAHCPSGNGTG